MPKLVQDLIKNQNHHDRRGYLSSTCLKRPYFEKQFQIYQRLVSNSKTEIGKRKENENHGKAP